MIKTESGSVSSGYRLYNFQSETVDETALNNFLNSYKPSEAVKLNNAPAVWAKPEMDKAITLQLIPHHMQNRYGNNINRSDFSKLVIHLLTVNTGKTIDALLVENGKAINTAVFKDTSDRTILAASALGIVNGRSDGNFDPYGDITRQEAAVLLTRTAKMLGIKVSSTGTSFGDSKDIASWAKDAVVFVSSVKDKTNNATIMGGTGNNKFSPNESYTRQQAFITAKRLFNAV